MLKRKDELTTKNLVLKPLENEDKNAVFFLLENPLVKRTYMSPVFKDENEKEKFFLKLKNLSHGKERFLYGIYLNKSLIGFINDTTVEKDMVELGYLISPKEWNKGYATEALSASISELFRMGFKAVECAHFEENPASGKVMQKCGMQKIEKTELIDYAGSKHLCIYYRIENKN